MTAPQRSINELSREVLGGAFMVSSTLGCGFLEKVYENALAIELRNRRLSVEQQRGMQVRYKGEVVGEYVADLLVEGRLMVEVKAVQELHAIHQAQCLNYLRASGLSLCLLINFARPRVEFQRIALTSMAPPACYGEGNRR